MFNHNCLRIISRLFAIPRFLPPCTRPSRGMPRRLPVVPLIADKRYYGEAPVGLWRYERAVGDAVPPIPPKTAKNLQPVIYQRVASMARRRGGGVSRGLCRSDGRFSVDWCLGDTGVVVPGLGTDAGVRARLWRGARVGLITRSAAQALPAVPVEATDAVVSRHRSERPRRRPHV
jgi:hypothetical protein